MNADYRKHQTNLLFSGIAIIAFGIWSAFKLTIYMRTNDMVMMERLGLADMVSGDSRAAFIVVGVAVILISMFVHLFIGISAIRDTRGKTKVRAYIPVSVLYICFIIVSYISVVFTGHMEGFYGNLLVSFIIDLTSFIALVIIIQSSQELKMLRKKQANA